MGVGEEEPIKKTKKNLGCYTSSNTGSYLKSVVNCSTQIVMKIDITFTFGDII